MKYAWILFGLTLLAALPSCRSVPQKTSQPRSAFAARIQSVVPPNWVLEEEGQEVIIRRKEPITKYPCVAMDVAVFRRPDGLKRYVDTNGYTGSYQIRLRRAPKVDAFDYQRLKAVNDQIVVTKNTPIPNRKFLEDDALRSYDSRYRELPEYYDESNSIYLETIFGPYECIYPNVVAKECEAVREKLNTLFNRYSSDNYPRTLGRDVD